MPNVMTTQDEGCSSLWQMVPDSVLLHVFSYLPTRILLHASQVCKVWHRVAMDEYLWKDLLYRTWHIDTHIAMAPGKLSWFQEFKRLYYHTPQIESEVLKDHRDQVLHISFSHNGQMFATSSKDGFIKVWTASYPSRVKYYADMREFTWKYTQYSQFNETDTLLLVSGVHFGAHSTSGEIAVFNLVDGFELQSRVLNKPYDIFGTWYNENYLLSGNLHWLGHLTSCSVLWLNKASQALEAENESVVMRLYKFRNINASSIRTVMIAKCHDDESTKTCTATASGTSGSVSVGAAAVASCSAANASSYNLIPPEYEPGMPQPGKPLEPIVAPRQQLPPTPPPAAPTHAEDDMSMRGAETSQSECSQGKTKSKVKKWQKMQMMHQADGGVSILEVDDSNDDGEETIEYNMDYRRAEESNLMDVSAGGKVEEGVEDEGEGDSNCSDINTATSTPQTPQHPLGDVDMIEASPSAKDSEPAEEMELVEEGPGFGMGIRAVPKSTWSPTSSKAARTVIGAVPKSAWSPKSSKAARTVAPASPRSGLLDSYPSSSSHFGSASWLRPDAGGGGDSRDSASVREDVRQGDGNSGGKVVRGGVRSARRLPQQSVGNSRGSDSASNSSNQGTMAKYLSSPSGDINVNTDSTGNNNNNPFSLHPLFGLLKQTPPRKGESPSKLESSEETLATLPTESSVSGAAQQQPIGATCTAQAPQPMPSTSAGCRMSELDFTGTGDRYLIFTTGMKTYTPHQIGIKRIRSLEEACPSSNVLVKESRHGARVMPDPVVNREEFDTVDHLIELHGHIIGMCLSPDHRYLYVNSRPWPQGYEIDDPLYPPPIAQEIDIHVIDLTTMHEVGTMLRAHKAYTPNDECFFIFLDVCQEYVASGAEDKHGYLWDRHYGVCLTKFPHADVVNSVAFNPQDPEMLITASDDNSLKIWRSRNREREVKGHLTKVDQ